MEPPAIVRSIVAAACVCVAAACVCVAAALASSAHAVPRSQVCGFVHARVPYSRATGGPTWRIYVRGEASCPAATRALDAVMHLRGVNHSNGFESNSYFTYGGWTCPYGQMGLQLCFLGSSGHERAKALARRCSEVSCPAHRVPVF